MPSSLTLIISDRAWRAGRAAKNPLVHLRLAELPALLVVDRLSPLRRKSILRWTQTRGVLVEVNQSQKR